jgi:uncharacterized ferritin-like protein (DUF455 family)
VKTYSTYAHALISGRRLEDKLQAPLGDLIDDGPGAQPVRPEKPGRSQKLEIAPRGVEVKVPPVSGMHDPDQRVRILHALANHELQATELFAWALLAFPDTPPSFRRGLLTILAEEQRHMALYIDRVRAHGHEFGDFPVTGHFWHRIKSVKTPLEFICTMGLTFENANLDFSGEYAAAAREAGDDETARVIDIVHGDEIRHVAFSWRWLRRLSGSDDAWQTYVANLSKPLHPGRARGKHFNRQSRELAGLDASFIDRLEAELPKRPGGAPR